MEGSWTHQQLDNENFVILELAANGNEWMVLQYIITSLFVHTYHTQASPHSQH